MPGRRELGAESVSDLAGDAGELSRLQATRGHSGDSREPRRTCRGGPRSLPEGTASGPDTPSRPLPAELSAGWGEFESFQEPEAERFSKSLELIDPSAPKEHGSRQARQGAPWGTGTAAGPSSELRLGSEDVFRFAFQEVSVEQAAEDICSLDHFLEMSSGENAGLTSVPRLCSESRKLWRALQNTTMSTSQGLWCDSRCQENLFLILGIDAAQKSLAQGQDHSPDSSDLREPEELLAVSSFRLHHCRALIQTKLSGTPGSGKGSLITYSLFLKTPLHGNGRYITIPRKKIFTPRSLRMALFKDVC